MFHFKILQFSAEKIKIPRAKHCSPWEREGFYGFTLV